MVQGSRGWIEGGRNDHLLPGHFGHLTDLGVKAEGIRHEMDAPPSAVRLRPRARCASPPSAGHRLRTLRVPALVTPESGVSATPPPRMVTPTGWEVATVGPAASAPRARCQPSRGADRDGKRAASLSHRNPPADARFPGTVPVLRGRPP